MAAIPGLGQVGARSLECHLFSHVGARNHALGPSSVAFPGRSLGIWIKSRAAGTQTFTHLDANTAGSGLAWYATTMAPIMEILIIVFKMYVVPSKNDQLLLTALLRASKIYYVLFLLSFQFKHFPISFVIYLTQFWKVYHEILWDLDLIQNMIYIYGFPGELENNVHCSVVRASVLKILIRLISLITLLRSVLYVYWLFCLVIL